MKFRCAEDRTTAIRNEMADGEENDGSANRKHKNTRENHHR